MKCGEGRWLADPVAETHEVYDRAHWVIDPDGFAGSPVHTGQPELEGLRVETKHRSWWEGDLRWPCRSWHRNLDRGGNLVSQVMDRGGG